ncbi:hypothetical protein [Thiomonas sp.]
MDTILEILLKADIPQERAEQMIKQMDALDPMAAVPVKDRFLEEPKTGKILLTPAYLVYYRKRFAEAGLNLDNYRANRKDFIQGLRAINAYAGEKLEAETDLHLAQTKDPAMRSAVEALRNKDFAEARRFTEIAQRRKGFKAV